jgi:hypothetical protein
MSSNLPTPQELLDRLDARHDELIERLDDLNGRIEQALTDMAQARSQESCAAA